MLRQEASVGRNDWLVQPTPAALQWHDGPQPAAHGLARHHVDIVPGEKPAVAQRASIGRQSYGQAAFDEFDTERFGGKQMTAGTAGGQQNEGRRIVHGFN